MGIGGWYGAYVDKNDARKLWEIGSAFVRTYLDAKFHKESRAAYSVRSFVQNDVHIENVAFGSGMVAVLDLQGGVWMFGDGKCGEMGNGMLRAVNATPVQRVRVRGDRRL